jgi:hypothetical protein
MNSLLELAKKIKLVKTCGACPEQYDAYIDDEQVGYLRLRHGYFYVAYPDVDGEVIFEAEPKGDGLFEYDERESYLAAARLAIINKHWEKLNGSSR